MTGTQPLDIAVVNNTPFWISN